MLFGSDTLVKEEQTVKVLFSILWTFPDISMLFKLELSKACSPIYVTLSGIIIFCKGVQAKAQFPIIRTFLGIKMLDKMGMQFEA